MYEIKQVPSNNHSSREKSIPFVIVNHITAGSLKSCDNWFTSPNNDVASAHFCVGRNGEIHQYVDLKKRSWHAGLTKDAIEYATAPVIKRFKMNPNAYTIGIEHEGYEGNGIDGALTEEQFWASVWLHRYIKEEVIRLYTRHIPLDRTHVIGHFQVDPRRKPNCPGPNFPWDRLYAELEIANRMTMKDFEQRLAYKMRDNDVEKMAEAIISRVEDLRQKYASRGTWFEAAGEKIKRIEEVLTNEKLF